MLRPVWMALLLAATSPAAARAQYGLDDPQPASAEVEVEVDVSGTSVGLDTFREALAPYGTWVDAPGYGTVWRPNVAADWRPYHYGRWVWTDEGWLWVSDEPWGWGPYHYGRWGWDTSSGWFWVPGTQWAPAWVSWRFSAGVVGWAPIAPGFSMYVGSFPWFYPAWTFMPCGYFVGYPVHHHAYPISHYPAHYRQTAPAPPRAAPYGARSPAWGGPAPGFVAQHTGRAVAPAPVRPVSSPAQLGRSGSGDAISVFRPERVGMAPGRASAAVPGGSGSAGAGPARSALAPGRGGTGLPAPAAARAGSSRAGDAHATGSAPRSAFGSPRASPWQGLPGGTSAPSSRWQGGSAASRWQGPQAVPGRVQGGAPQAAPRSFAPPSGGGGRPAPAWGGGGGGYRAGPAAGGGFRAAPAPPGGGARAAPAAPSGGGRGGRH